MEFSDALLKRIMLLNNEEKGEEYVAENYDKSIEELTWHLIKEQLVEANDIKVEQEDVDWKRFETMEESGLKEGEMIDVKLIGVDEKTGKLKLSHRALLPKPEGYVERERRPRGDRDRRRDDRHRD